MKTMLVLGALLLGSCTAGRPPSISVDGAWARATVASQMSSAAYFTIRNTGGEDKLLAVTSPAGNASLHSTSMEGGVMRMRPLSGLDVPANGTVELKPGGTHVMVTALKSPLVAGSTIDLDLKFEKSGDRHVAAQVRSADGATM